MEQVAVTHWRSVADAEHQDAYFWVVVRHEIDYLRAVLEGERITARTWAGDNLKGAKFDRHIEFLGEDGKARVRSRTDWAIIDKASGRPIRIPPEVVAPFTSAG
jgi:acyl-CoA thioester hydrolase